MTRAIAAGTAALLMVLMAFTVYRAITGDDLVVPTNGVIGRATTDDPAEGAVGQEALVARADLQRWRGVSGPSPGDPTPAAPTVGTQGAASTAPEGVEVSRPDGRELVRTWTQRRDEHAEHLPREQLDPSDGRQEQEGERAYLAVVEHRVACQHRHDAEELGEHQPSRRAHDEAGERVDGGSAVRREARKPRTERGAAVRSARDGVEDQQRGDDDACDGEEQGCDHGEHRRLAELLAPFASRDVEDAADHSVAHVR